MLGTHVIILQYLYYIVRFKQITTNILIDKNSKILVALQPSECTQIKEITMGFIWVLSFKCSLL